MTKKLILAEKPSVGLTYAALLGADRKFDGYMEGTYCIVNWHPRKPTMKNIRNGTAPTCPLYRRTGF